MPARRAYLSLTLIRCGRTPWEEAGRLQGRTNLPLSDTGRAEVEAILPYLRGASFRSVQHPPDDAASETARLAGRACSAKAREAADLVEPDLGLWEGLADQQFAERYPKRLKQWQDDPMSLIPPEGEPFAEARDRVLGAVSRLLRRARTGEVAVVLHPMALGLAQCWLADRPAAEFRAMGRNGSPVERYVLSPEAAERLGRAKTAAVTTDARRA